MSVEPTDSADAQAPTLGARSAVVLVFLSSAAVLVIELVALRLLAPYLGLTLETNTLVIGIALAAIALGSWAGGRIADRTDPRRLIGPALAISGAAAAATPFLVRAAGAAADGALLLPAAAASIIVPGALLSAVTPMVTKLRLTDLAETGTVVGRLSGIGTVGSIVGTVITGFVLISRVPVSGILVGLGAALVIGSIIVEIMLRRPAGIVAPVLAVVAGGVAAAVAPGGCDAETTYHCASVQTDPDRENGRILMLDGLRHSYVDLADPTYLQFAYVTAMASVIDTAFPEGAPIDAYHLGGGGMTLPRYLEQVRPGTTSLVSEIDGGVVRIDRERLGLVTGDDLEVRVEDGRLGLGRLASDSRHLVVGDAFGGVSVPWHLTTREALTEVHRVLDEDGIYVANLIDHGRQQFARAETATIGEVFEHVAVLGPPNDLGIGDVPADGGNLVVVASDRPIDLDAVRASLTARDSDWAVISDDALTEWIGDAIVLTDNYAPVDQILEPYPATSRSR
ncbi:fused MFS/spermidine synthase [Millisia brevis]|uniref:fused MFS/spermidine synthase n=1 Tax=Millisia brevis TaxID=264148 RepID=UPI000831EAAE|nr:fused MFS/spermidine synthase [Millisia brevis]